MEQFVLELDGPVGRRYAASAFTRRCSLDLYRAAVFFLMMPVLADRSITENVLGKQFRGGLGILAE